MQLTFDPRDLTQQQRSHIAAFLTDWPVAKHEGFKFPQIVGRAVRPDGTAWSAAEMLDGQRNAVAAGEPIQLATGSASSEPTFSGKTEAQLLADEQAADMQPLNPADDNSDKAAAQAAFTPSATPDRDGEGLPWDRRIHSSGKALNADGRWRIARNVAPEMIESVKAELRALVAAPVAHDASLSPEDLPKQVEPAIVPPPPAAEPVAVVPPPPPVSVSIDPAAPSTDINVMFTTLLRDAGQAVVAQRITSAELTAICVAHGVANVGLLASRKDLVPQIDADFRAMLAGKVHA